MSKQLRPARGNILPDDHLRGRQSLRTDYSQFETPTYVRRLVERARENRRGKQS